MILKVGFHSVCPPLPGGSIFFNATTNTTFYTVPGNITSFPSQFTGDQITYSFGYVANGPDEGVLQVLPSTLTQAHFVPGGNPIRATYFYPYINPAAPSPADIENPLQELCNHSPPFDPPAQPGGTSWFCTSQNHLLLASIVSPVGFKYATVLATRFGVDLWVQRSSAILRNLQHHNLRGVKPDRDFPFFRPV